MNYYRDYYNYLNNNYNQPNYNQNNVSLYEPYEGFIRGNMFKDLYNKYKTNEPIKIVPKNKQAEILTTIYCLELAIIDLGMYLDTHPNDKEILERFNMYRKDYNEYTYEYQKQYGPLTIYSESLNDYPYAWINSPWPWEGDNNVEV